MCTCASVPLCLSVCIFCLVCACVRACVRARARARACVCVCVARAARDSKLCRELMPAVLPLTLTCFIGMLLSALALFHVQAILYMSFIVLTLFRAFIYGIGTAFLLVR